MCLLLQFLQAASSVTLKRKQAFPDWGVYQILWHHRQYDEQLLEKLNILGSKPQYVLFFHDLKRGFPADILKKNRARGIDCIVSLELTQWGSQESNHLEQIVAGQYDEFMKAWAQEAALYKSPVFLRFGFEMNGSWFTWGGKPESFKKAWRRVHKIFQDNAAGNVQWVFSPNVLYAEKEFQTDILPYYPGADVVDWVSLDGYNFGDHHSRYHRWTSYSEIFSKSLDGMATFAKPMLISEIGCAHDVRKSEWLKDVLLSVTQDHRIHAFVYFDFDKRREGEPDWRINSDAASLAVFKNWLQLRSHPKD